MKSIRYWLSQAEEMEARSKYGERELEPVTAEDLQDFDSDAEIFETLTLYFHLCQKCGKPLGRSTVSTLCKTCSKEQRKIGEQYRQLEKEQRRREYWAQRDLQKKLEAGGEDGRS